MGTDGKDWVAGMSRAPRHRRRGLPRLRLGGACGTSSCACSLWVQTCVPEERSTHAVHSSRGSVRMTQPRLRSTTAAPPPRPSCRPTATAATRPRVQLTSSDTLRRTTLACCVSRTSRSGEGWASRSRSDGSILRCTRPSRTSSSSGDLFPRTKRGSPLACFSLLSASPPRPAVRVLSDALPMPTR